MYIESIIRDSQFGGLYNRLGVHEFQLVLHITGLAQTQASGGLDAVGK